MRKVVFLALENGFGFDTRLDGQTPRIVTGPTNSTGLRLLESYGFSFVTLSLPPADGAVPPLAASGRRFTPDAVHEGPAILARYTMPRAGAADGADETFPLNPERIKTIAWSLKAAMRFCQATVLNSWLITTSAESVDAASELGLRACFLMPADTVSRGNKALRSRPLHAPNLNVAAIHILTLESDPANENDFAVGH